VSDVEKTLDSLFWLVFKNADDVAVMIQLAGHIIPARIRALLAGVEGEFQEGYELDAGMAKKVPKAQIGKLLSRAQAAALLKKLDK
jgi:hypothetical protein